MLSDKRHSPSISKSNFKLRKILTQALLSLLGLHDVEIGTCYSVTPHVVYLEIINFKL